MADEGKGESIETQVEQTLEEARMVLPGLQALFGFQMVAVFSERFDQALADTGRGLHLAAVVLTVIAIGLIMAPAAYQRQVEPERVSRYFVSYASSLITWAMGPLCIALAIEVSLVAFLVTGQVGPSALIGMALTLLLAWLWYGFPAYRKRRQAGAPRPRRKRRA